MTWCLRIESGTLMCLKIEVIDPVGRIAHLSRTAPSERPWLQSRRVQGALSDKPESACEGCRSEAFKPRADAIRPERLIGSA